MGVTPRIEVTIERLIVDGWSPEDAARLAGAIEVALARAFEGSGAALAGGVGREIAALDAGHVALAAGTADAIAARVVDAVRDGQAR